MSKNQKMTPDMAEIMNQFVDFAVSTFSESSKKSRPPIRKDLIKAFNSKFHLTHRVSETDVTACFKSDDIKT